MLGKYGKLLLGAYILRKLNSGNSHKVSEHKKDGLLSKYGKLILGAYLMKKLRSEEDYYGTRGHEESTKGMLSKYGKIMLTTYAVKKLRSEKPGAETEKPKQYTEPSMVSKLPHMVKKYWKWLMGAYLLKNAYHRKPQVEMEEMVEEEAYEESKGLSTVKLSAIVLGVLAGATAIYAFKKYGTKYRGCRIEVE